MTSDISTSLLTICHSHQMYNQIHSFRNIARNQFFWQFLSTCYHSNKSFHSLSSVVGMKGSHTAKVSCIHCLHHGISFLPLTSPTIIISGRERRAVITSDIMSISPVLLCSQVLLPSVLHLMSKLHFYRIFNRYNGKFWRNIFR